ncbi:MAG: sulfatase-like hydrolase/transferase [Cyclobacteriaceae bacterium]|nr:sulfatase-like hydrolase/transferase [Cyclobacteriaceae bacterium]
MIVRRRRLSWVYLQKTHQRHCRKGKTIIPKKERNRSIAEWMNSRTLPNPVDDAHSQGTFFANEAIRFMESNKSGPFFLWLAFKEPHHPYYFPVEYAGKYKPADMPLPQGSPEDDRWIPEKFRNLTDDERRGIIAAYYTSTEYLDKNVGLVLDAVKALGLEENTLVMYLSDNGYLLYDHKRFEKHTAWQEAVHQPLIVKTGKNPLGASNFNAIVEYVDIVPTILDLLQMPPLKEAQGSSFGHLLYNPDRPHKEYAFAEYLEDNMAMVSDSEWKYVFATGSRDLGIGYKTGYGPSGVVHHLYDLTTDPKESKNLAGDTAYFETLNHYQGLLLPHFPKNPSGCRCVSGGTHDGG